MGKLAVIFPGIGYGCDKPLLYYSRKLLKSKGYDVKCISYDETGLDLEKIRRDPQPAVEKIIEAAKKQLAGTDIKGAEKLVLISKSIGTVAASAFAKFGEIEARHILFTPVEKTFMFLDGVDGTVFIGTRDPFADYDSIEELCRKKDIRVFKTEGGDHSLETGNILLDMDNVKNIIKTLDKKF